MRASFLPAGLFPPSLSLFPLAAMRAGPSPSAHYSLTLAATSDSTVSDDNNDTWRQVTCLVLSFTNTAQMPATLCLALNPNYITKWTQTTIQRQSCPTYFQILNISRPRFRISNLFRVQYVWARISYVSQWFYLLVCMQPSMHTFINFILPITKVYYTGVKNKRLQ